MLVSLQITVAYAVLAATEQSMSLFRLFLKGGALMWVLLALSIIAIYLIGKKWWAIRKAGKRDGNFMARVRSLILAGRHADAKNLCRHNDNAMARLIETGIGKIGSPIDDIHATMENRGSAEIAKLEKGLPTLATISGGAPMIGFLGTVIGMVQAFFNMSNAGNNIDITMLSGGIYMAMMTTVGGLIVGIIAYFGYNYLSSEISALVTKLEDGTFEFIEIVKESGNRAGITGTAEAVTVQGNAATAGTKTVQRNAVPTAAKTAQRSTDTAGNGNRATKVNAETAENKPAQGNAVPKAPENKTNTTKPTENATAKKGTWK